MDSFSICCSSWKNLSQKHFLHAYEKQIVPELCHQSMCQSPSVCLGCTLKQAQPDVSVIVRPATDTRMPAQLIINLGKLCCYNLNSYSTSLMVTLILYHTPSLFSPQHQFFMRSHLSLGGRMSSQHWVLESSPMPKTLIFPEHRPTWRKTLGCMSSYLRILPTSNQDIPVFWGIVLSEFF